MLNRYLCRVKVVQMVYACRLKGEHDIAAGEKELLRSFQQTEQAYYYLLSLPLSLVNKERSRIERGKEKFLPTTEEANPNMKLVNGKLVRWLASIMEDKYLSFWEEHGNALLPHLLDFFKRQDLVRQYMEISAYSLKEERALWEHFYMDFLPKRKEIEELFEEHGIYWNDDISFLLTVCVKTLQVLNSSTAKDFRFLPLFRDAEEKEFVVTLFCKTLLQWNKQLEKVGARLNGWELERLAQMDKVILATALTEAEEFPHIHPTVTINEFLYIAHFYGTPKSAAFINGVLDALFKSIKPFQK